MKYTGETKAGSDVTVYNFTFGQLEARLMRDLLVNFTKSNKGIFENLPAYNRARNILKELNENVPMNVKKFIHPTN